MKRFLALVLTVGMLCGALAGCGGEVSAQQASADTSQKNQESPTVYPDGAAAIIEDTDKITAPPSTVYTTPAEENGLGGTMYKFVGTVEKHISAQDSESGVEYIIVDTGEGKASIVSPVQSLLAVAGAVPVDQKKLQAFFKFPDEGEYVCVYALYQGYSELLQCASSVYGGEYYTGYALGKAMTSETDIQSEATLDNSKNDTPEAPKEPESIQTTGQKNALSKAKDYLAIMAFSHSGIVEQLKHDGFSADEATYAADKCGADWNAQAVNKAQAYLDLMSFSRSGLIDQLKYDGFSSEQAEYGATAVGY